MADNGPHQAGGTVPCNCRAIYHWRNNTPCPNPARYCLWCRDGGCTLQREADARRDARELQRSRGGGDRPPGMGFPFPMTFNPYGPQLLGPGGYDDDDDSESPD